MKCKDCTVFGCQHRTTDAEKDCYYETQYTAKEQFDWQSFRNQAAKDILCAVISGGISSGAGSIIPEKENLVKVSIDIANELVKQLKEKEEK